MAEKRRKFGRDFGEGSVRLVLFKRLPQPEIERIADLMFNDLCTWLAERRITLDPAEDAALHPQAGIRSGLWRPAAAPIYRSRGGNHYRPRAARRDVHDGAVIRVGLDHDEIAVTCDSPGAGQQRGAEQPQLSSQ